MSILDQNKANVNFMKFVVNLRKLIGKTNSIIVGIMAVNSKIAEEYKFIPMSLTFVCDFIEKTPDKVKEIFIEFINKSMHLWPNIMNKDDSILTEHLSIILPGNKYVEKIQYIYREKLVNNDDVATMWKCLHGIVHNSIKYIMFSEDPRFFNILDKSLIKTYGINLN
jgi:hypothetical protein